MNYKSRNFTTIRFDKHDNETTWPDIFIVTRVIRTVR